MTLKELWQSMAKLEWRFVGITWFIVSALSLLPFLWALPHLSNGFHLSGIHSMAYGDMNVYLSYIRQVEDGHYLLQTLLTAPAADFLMVRPLWLMVGLLGKVLQLSPLLTFHVARVLLSGVLLTVLYLFLRLVITDGRQRRFAFLIFAITTGIGVWLVLPIQILRPDFAFTLEWPIDLWVPEAFISLSMINSPHFIFAWTLLLVIYGLWLLMIGNQSHRPRLYLYAALAGIAALYLFVFHPFHILPVAALLTIHFMWLCFVARKFLWSLFIGLVIIGSISFWGVYYHLFMLGHDWLTAVKALQNHTPNPSLWMMLAGFILLPLALWEAGRWVQRRWQRDPVKSFVLIFLVLQPALVWLPILWQRRMLQGWQVPIVILAAAWLWPRLEPYLHKGKWLHPRIVGWFMAAVFLVLITSLYNYIRDGYYYATGQPLFYYPPSLYQGLTELRGLTGESARILSHPIPGNFIVGVAGRHVLVGHGVETAYYIQLEPLVKSFFHDNEPDQRKRLWLKQWGITHLFYSDYEKELGSFDPASQDYLQLVWQNDSVQIYRVLPDRL